MAGKDEMLKLNIGSRNRLMDGYINMDPDPDLFPYSKRHFLSENVQILHAGVFDVDRYFATDSVDEVHSAHCFEHLTHEQITQALYKLWAVLKPKHSLIITVPDYWEIINHYREKHKAGDFNDVDILHLKVFDVKEETFHKSVWYPEIGMFYLERENLFKVQSVTKPSLLEVTFTATKQG